MNKLTILAGTLALSVAALPISASINSTGLHLKAASAFAKDGHSGGGGGDGGGGGGGDSGGRDGGSSGGHGGGSSGHGGGDDGGNDDGGHRGGNDDGPGDDDGGRRGAEHIDRATGAKIEVSGNSIEVRYANGVKEELENGRYEVKDASGRTIVERTATAEDIARMNDLAN